MKSVVGNRHQKAEAAKQKAGKILDQTSEEALTVLAEVDKMKREHEVPVVHRVLRGCRCLLTRSMWQFRASETL
jgi:hypothetical protein